MADTLPGFDQLRWLCRRGTRELDRILGGFLEEDYRNARPEMQRAFVSLLSCQDPDIYDWLMDARAVPEPELETIIARLQKKYGIHPGT